MKWRAGNKFFNYPFLEICTIHLATIISCCTCSHVYKLCIKNKTMSMISLHPDFTFVWMPNTLSLCQHFLNVRLLLTHDPSRYNIRSPSSQWCFIFRRYFDLHSEVSTLSIKILYFDWHFLHLNPTVLQLCLKTLGPKKMYFFYNWQQVWDGWNSFSFDTEILFCVPKCTLVKIIHIHHKERYFYSFLVAFLMFFHSCQFSWL